MTREKALKLLKILRDDYIHGELDKDINEAISELKEEQRLKCASIEEIEYALLKPEYASVYLNNALRFLKENK